jgi:hypothetical protein
MTISLTVCSWTSRSGRRKRQTWWNQTISEMYIVIQGFKSNYVMVVLCLIKMEAVQIKKVSAELESNRRELGKSVMITTTAN